MCRLLGEMKSVVYDITGTIVEGYYINNGGFEKSSNEDVMTDFISVSEGDLIEATFSLYNGNTIRTQGIWLYSSSDESTVVRRWSTSINGQTSGWDTNNNTVRWIIPSSGYIRVGSYWGYDVKNLSVKRISFA